MRMILAASPLAAEAGIEDHVIVRLTDQFRYNHGRQGRSLRVYPLIDGQIDDIIVAAFCKRMNEAKVGDTAGAHEQT